MSAQSKAEDAVRRAEKSADKKAKAAKKSKGITRNNSVLAELVAEDVPIDSIKPNKYNPNRQSEHDFKLLCQSIVEDGFTQPVVAIKDTREIVDGEHRWRACKALGHKTISVVFTEMSPEQMRISTLRHNRARGSEDPALAGVVMQQLAALGGIEQAAESLMLDQVEVERLMNEMGDVEASMLSVEVPDSQLGPNGEGLAAGDANVDLTADTFRAKQLLVEQAKRGEQNDMVAADDAVYRLMLFFTGEEAVMVRAVLNVGESQAATLRALCQRQQGTQAQ